MWADAWEYLRNEDVSLLKLLSQEADEDMQIESAMNLGIVYGNEIKIIEILIRCFNIEMNLHNFFLWSMIELSVV